MRLTFFRHSSGRSHAPDFLERVSDRFSGGNCVFIFERITECFKRECAPAKDLTRELRSFAMRREVSQDN
jgi:hypothetical protein